METLYSKLYDKYTKLKTRKETEMEKLTHDQEVKFMNYVSAAEDLIEHLRNENKRLHEHIDDLTNEAASIRSSKESQLAEYQKLLIEENQKNKELSEEVERLQNMQREGLCSSSKDRNNVSEQLESPGGTQVEPRDLSNVASKRIKRPIHAGAQTEEANAISYAASDQVEHDAVREPESDPQKATLSDYALGKIQQPDCCRGSTASSGGGVNDVAPANHLFQSLLECLVGMKFSPANQTEACLSVVHQSSGYSFSLTWISKTAGEETELLYHVLSLGTFERVAPEWMREALMFSISMCPIFFERVSRVIRLHQ